MNLNVIKIVESSLIDWFVIGLKNILKFEKILRGILVFSSTNFVVSNKNGFLNINLYLFLTIFDQISTKYKIKTISICLFVKKFNSKVQSVSLFFKIVSVVDREVILINGVTVKREKIKINNKYCGCALEVFWCFALVSSILFKVKDKQILSILGNL